MVAVCAFNPSRQKQVDCYDFGLAWSSSRPSRTPQCESLLKKKKSKQENTAVNGRLGGVYSTQETRKKAA